MKQLISKLKPASVANKLASYGYTKQYQKCQVDQHLILLESKHGEDIAGNIFHMLRILQEPAFEEYQILLAITDKIEHRYKTLVEKYQIKRVTPVRYLSKEYYHALASAGYLITDTSFTSRYIKKEGQIYLNTWHGTPLKDMGRVETGREFALGNIQRNFMISDILLYQNEFSKDVFLDDYMIRDLFHGTILVSGYPRNSAFYAEQDAKKLREKHQLAGKQLIAYMPTWRGLLHKNDINRQVSTIVHYLSEIDQQLQGNQIFFVKLHPFVSEAIDYSRFNKIRPFIADYDTYDFLNAVDVLVTDYSSIMFDFAVTGRKIILFPYDRKEYLHDRGMYLDVDSLGLPVVETTNELMKELERPHKEYENFQRCYCSHDSADCARDTVLALLNFDKTKRAVHPKKKAQVLLYCPDVSKREVLLDIIDKVNQQEGKDETCYYLGFKGNQAEKHTEVLTELDRNVGFIPVLGRADLLLTEYVLCRLYQRQKGRNRFLQRQIKKISKRVIRQFFGNVRFDQIIDYQRGVVIDETTLALLLIG